MRQIQEIWRVANGWLIMQSPSPASRTWAPNEGTTWVAPTVEVALQILSQLMQAEEKRNNERGIAEKSLADCGLEPKNWVIAEPRQ